MDLVLYFRPPFARPEKLDGVREIAEKYGTHVQVVDEPPTRERTARLLAFWKPAGIVVECGGLETAIDPRIFGKTPVVFFNHRFETLPKRCFAVRHNSKSIGMLAARELLQTETDNFAYVQVPGNPFWCQEREQGFREALALNGKTCTTFSCCDADMTPTERSASLMKFLGSLPKPCALFAANDRIAAEVIVTARMRGIAIPDELAVLGVDNALDICEHTNPPLSSIDADFRCGGNLAMMMLLAVLRGGKDFHGSRRQTYGDLHIVRRLSTKRLLRSDPIVTEAMDLIRRRACDRLRAVDVTKLFPCSRRMADLRFSRAVGHSILDEIHAVRLDRAKQFLLTSNVQLKSISDFCGFKNPNSLRKFFLRATKQTLTAWRKKHARQPA